MYKKMYDICMKLIDKAGFYCFFGIEISCSLKKRKSPYLFSINAPNLRKCPKPIYINSPLPNP